MGEYIKTVVILSYNVCFSKQGRRVAEGQIKQRQKRTV